MVRWQPLPPIDSPAPVLSLAADESALWAGGIGGVARSTDRWQSLLSGLPIRSVTALARVDDWLYAGGEGGIARFHTKNSAWERTDTENIVSPVTAFAVSPTDSSVMLAATLQQGVLRSTDGGRGWKAATFGMESLECTSLIWLENETVLVGTAGGVHRSPNGGRAWRLCAGTEGAPIAALAVLPDRTILAGVELGGILRSVDGGETWHRWGNLPPEIAILSLLAIENAVFVGSAEHGLLRSSDNAVSWERIADIAALSCAATPSALSIGTDTGVIGSEDGGETWQALPTPPLSDHHSLLVIDGKPLVYGIQSAPVLYDAHSGWKTLSNAPHPLTALTRSPDGGLLAASPAGVFRSDDAGTSWLAAHRGSGNHITHLSIQPDGTGYAGGGNHLLRTRDFGVTWEPLPSPFGVLSLAALQAFESPIGTPGTVLAATYDPRGQVAQIWHSPDEGETWARGVQAHTTWEYVSTLAQPPLFTLGGFVFLKQPSGQWEQRRVGEGARAGAVRRIVGSSGVLFALTTTGLFRSGDGGNTWENEPSDLPIEHITDLALSGKTLYALLAGGQVSISD